MKHYQFRGVNGLGDATADRCFQTLADDPDNPFCKAYVTAHTTARCK